MIFYKSYYFGNELDSKYFIDNEEDRDINSCPQVLTRYLERKYFVLGFLTLALVNQLVFSSKVR